VALSKANEAAKFGGALPALTPEETPRLFRGAYGIGSRDFRPEHSLGAYEFATGTTKRKDGKLEVTYNRHPLYYFVGDRKPGQARETIDFPPGL